MQRKEQDMKNTAILLDIDGTLTNSEREVTEKTREVLIRAQELGARLVLSSGRPEQGLGRVADALRMREFGGIFICYNGAKVLNCETGEVLFSAPIPIESAKAVLRHLKDFEVMPMIDRGSYMYVTDVFRNTIHPHIPGRPENFNVMEYEARGNGFLLCEQKDLASFLDYDLYKILTFGEPDYLQAHYREMEAPFRESLSCMFTEPFYFEFTAQGIDKAKAIESALLPLGYEKKDLIAFGDAPNDISMLKASGTGVAMENASPEVKAAADAVTLSNNEDGVAEYVLRNLM